MTRPLRFLPAFVLPAVAALGLGISAMGQARQTATGLIVGQIVDAAAGKPIAGAVVTLTERLPPFGWRSPGAS